MRDKISKTIVPGAVCFTFGVIMYLLMPEQVQTEETSAVTARTFPSLALAIVIVCGGILVLQGCFALLREWKKTGSAARAEGPQGDAGPAGNPVFLLMVLVLMAGAVVLGDIAGLLVSGVVIGVGFLALYRDKNILHYIIVTAIIVGSYFLFKRMFGLQLP